MGSATDSDLRLSNDERQCFERCGYVVRRDVFSPAELADIAGACEALVEEIVTGREQHRQTFGSYVFDADRERTVIVKWEGDSDVVHGIEPFAHLSPTLAAWGYDERLTTPMRDMLGYDEVELYTEKLNLKRPQVGGPNPLHQDYPYWVNGAEDAAEIATTIIFLDDSTIENGCLWVVPGSHRDGPWRTRSDGDAFAANEIDEAAYADADIVPVELPAGSTLSFGSFLVHRSAPNTSEHGRRALLYSYQPAGRRTQVDNLRSLHSPS
jgi:ectoine hydroxylase-related dioxygenase (phytanoyl-CoA dioxygenase family)